MPEARAEYTESDSAFAASQNGIAMGGPHGGGSHGIPGGAKENTILWVYNDYSNDGYWGDIWVEEEDVQ